MPSFTVKLKWGKELFEGVDLNTDEEPMVFKAQVFALTGVQPHRQKVMVKGAVLKDESWDLIKVKNGATLLLMGSKEEDIPSGTPLQKTQFIEDMDESQINSALKMPAGLTNLGNTCYMNATVQCLKSVPEFKEALLDFEGGGAGGGAADSPFSQAITAALRDLYKLMEGGSTVPPIMLLQVLHSAFPRFAERGEQGGYQQQDANECWVELMNMLKQKLMVKAHGDSASPAAAAATRSVVDDYFGLEFETETKCVEAEDEPVSKSKERFLQYNCYIDKEVKYLASGLKNRLQESLTKKSPTLDRDAEYVKTLRVSRLPGYLTIQMVRFQFKQKDAINAKILKDVKFPMMLDTFELCTAELQQKLVPMRKKFKAHEDFIVEQASKDKAKGGREAALKASRDEGEGKETEPYFFEGDPGSNNSGYYELQAILTHKGRSSNSGHYVAWVKHKGDTWIECNDDDVSPVHVEDVMKLSGGGDWHCAYLLIYGPRKLPKGFGEGEAEKEVAKAASSTAAGGAGATEEKMETS